MALAGDQSAGKTALHPRSGRWQRWLTEVLRPVVGLLVGQGRRKTALTEKAKLDVVRDGEPEQHARIAKEVQKQTGEAYAVLVAAVGVAGPRVGLTSEQVVELRREIGVVVAEG